MSRGMAHDLNNLITPVWTFLQLLREGLAAHTGTDELLPTAIRNVEAIRQYVKESLFYSTTLTPHFRTARLDECVLKAIDLVQPQLRLRNITARAENLSRVEVEMDFILIQRLLCNLLGNACDASPANAQIEVRILPLAKTEVGREWFRVLVTDHGEGISVENLKHIFRPYFTTKDRGGRRGFGLGLAICRKIVHLHGGNLNVESQIHKGTTVMMDLPSRQQEKPPAKPKPELLVAK
jgi:signal transduction histidine kinase